jgi:hypothetical protein
MHSPETETKMEYIILLQKIREITSSKLFLADFSHFEPKWGTVVAEPYFTAILLRGVSVVKATSMA